MNGPGAPDPIYVAARRVLLDALGALEAHLGAITLVGAQAVYVHAGDADLAVAPFTTDGDLAIDPRQLGREPLIEHALAGAKFRLVEGKVGMWEALTNVDGTDRTVTVDLLVPDSLGGPGRRGARIPPHDKTVARKATGLEAAVIDRDVTTIRALDPDDHRQFELAVAGPSGLIVAKTHKILDRVSARERVSDKDALDVLRLFRAVSTHDLARRFAKLLANDVSSMVTQAAIAALNRLFGSPTAAGCEMAIRAAGPFESGDIIAASLVALTGDLLSTIGSNLP